MYNKHTVFVKMVQDPINRNLDHQERIQHIRMVDSTAAKTPKSSHIST